MIDDGINKNSNAFHLAGIVPVAGQPLEFDYPWHPSLNPIGSDYLSLERAVYECATAGCETIWVVCHHGTHPILRKRLGEWIKDPISTGRFLSTDEERRIPIYYVPIHPKDRERRDCLGWSVLYGALTAYWISRKMSKWVTPDLYFVSFPYGAYDPEVVRPHRKDISSRKKFLLKNGGKTIKDGLPLAFTFDAEDFKSCRRHVREMSTTSHDANGRKLPMKERYSARYFPLDKVFESVIIDADTKQVDVPWFYDISTWQGYREYLGSDKQLIKPPEVKYNEWNEIDRWRNEPSDDE